MWRSAAFGLALLALVAVPFGPARAAPEAQAALIASIPDGNTLSFRAYTGDTDLGLHKMRWTVSPEAVVVNIEIDLGARVVFLPVYSYKHRSQETWKGGALAAIATSTDDDGDKFSVKGELKGGAFDIKGTAYTGPGPLPLAPTSYWAYSSLKKPNWLNTQSGKLLKISVTPKGVETIKTRAGQLKANRYDVTGDLDVSLWYDDKKRWVKSRFAVGERTITYVLQ